MSLRKAEEGEKPDEEEKPQDAKEVEPSSIYAYSKFVKDRKKYELLQRLLPQMETLAEELKVEVDDGDYDLRPSGYVFDGKDSYDDGVRNKNESNILLNVLSKLEENPDFLLGNEQKRIPASSVYIKDGIHVAVEPPMRLDKETKETVRRSKKTNLDLNRLQESFVDLLSKSFNVEGEENMSFFDAIKNLHINRFKKTPISRRSDADYSKEIRRAKDLIMGINTDPIRPKVKRLGRILRDYNELKEYDVKLMDKVSELEEILEGNDVEEIISRKINSINRTIRSLMEEGKYNELQEKYKEISSIRENPQQVIDEVKVEIEQEIESYKDKMNEVAKDLNEILRYEDELEETIDLIRSYLRLDSEGAERDIAREEKNLERLKGRESTSEAQIKEVEEDLTYYRRRMNKILDIRKLLISNADILFDLEDEFKLMNKTLNKLKDADEKDVSDLVDAIATYSMFRSPESRQQVRSKREAINRVTSITIEEIDKAVEASTEAVENLVKLQTNIEEAKKKFEEVRMK